MKKSTLIAAALALCSLAANAADKVFYKIATDKDPGWTIQDATNFEGTPGKDYYNAYNKKNGGRMLNFFPDAETVWKNADVNNLPNNQYKYTMDLKMTTMAARGDMEFTLLPVGACTSSDARVSTHNYHWWNSTDTEDYFFRWRVMTAPAAANGEYTIIINENPTARNNWVTSENTDSILVMESGVKYNFSVVINVANKTADYTISKYTDEEAGTMVAVKTGSHTYVCEENRAGIQIFSMNGTSVHQLSNMTLSYESDAEPATDPQVDLIYVMGAERMYMAKFAEGHTLHWNQLGDAEDLISGNSYTNGDDCTADYDSSIDTEGFEEGEDKGQKIIYCTESGTLNVYTVRDDNEEKSNEVTNEVECVKVTLPSATAAITNVSEGYEKEYTLTVDNSEVPTTPTITIMYSTDNGANWVKGASGEVVKVGQGTLQFYSMDATHPSEYFDRSETTTINNNVKYVTYSTTNYDLSKAEVEAGKDGFTATTITDSGNKSHWDRIYSDQWYGYDADGNANAITADDGSWAYTKKGFGYYPGTAIGTTDATWPVLQVNTDAFETAVQPLQIQTNDKTNDTWYIMPQEGLVSYQTSVTNVSIGIDPMYTSDDTDKPNFYIVTIVGGYDRPDKGNCESTAVVQAGTDYSLYRYDTAIKSVRIMTYEGFTPGETAIQGVAAVNNVAAQKTVKVASANGIQIVKGAKVFNVAGAQVK